MYLVFLLAISAGIGYLLARSRYSSRIEETTTAVSRSWTARFSTWWRSRFGRTPQEDDFRAWALGPGAEHFPAEFRDWLGGLSLEQAKAFSHALSEYSRTLGYDLKALVQGDLKNQPAMMQVFVEAVVIYSQEYRKAREAQVEAKKDGDEPAEEKPQKVNGKQQAEKRPSRRKKEVPEVVSVA